MIIVLNIPPVHEHKRLLPLRAACSVFVHSEGATRAYTWSHTPPPATTRRAMPW